ncbi:phenylalanine--tRNA ligase beta subunit-related protein [Pseudomonas quasicaspiana]|uniref:phenylalanine--tRNA ligase beta subunit-related protein n=1 Tax=Pseudomonas quasicaspiana TaxID=2829821 RepID=UPI0038735D97
MNELTAQSTSVNPVVDIGNYLSLRYGVCVGSYDANHIHGLVSFGVGDPQAQYLGIANKTIKLKGIPAVRDDLGFFGSLHADSQRTCVGGQTEDMLMLFFYPSELLCPTIVQEQAGALLDEYCSIHISDFGVCN